MHAILSTVLACFLLAAPLQASLAQSSTGASRAEPTPEQHRGGKRHRGGGLERALETVELPEQVRTDVDALLDQSRKVQRNLRRSLRKANQGMRKLLVADNPSEAAILEQAESIGRLKTDIEKDRLLTLLRVRGKLSPEHREELTAKLKARKRQRRQMHKAQPRKLRKTE